jgi:hypothetical protein
MAAVIALVAFGLFILLTRPTTQGAATSPTPSARVELSFSPLPAISVTPATTAPTPSAAPAQTPVPTPTARGTTIPLPSATR